MKNKYITIKFSDFKSSIAAKVILIVGIIIIISIFALGFVVNDSISEKITTMIEQRNLEIAGMVEKELNSFLNEAKSSLLLMSRDYGLRSNNKVRIVARSMFVRVLETSPYFQSVFFIAAARKVVTRQIITFGLAILVLMIIIIITILEHYLIRPLLLISNSMEKVAQGDLKTKINLKRSDEIGSLAQTFNLMVKQFSLNDD